LTGVSPLLMHADDVEWRTTISDWRNDPLNKKKGNAGDDRSPAWSWIGYTYRDAGLIGIPSDNLMTCIRDGASQVIVKGNKTFKAQSQSGIMVDDFLWPIMVNGKTVPWDKIESLIGQEDFEEHKKTAIESGFELFVKPAKVGTAKHIRVRPRFNTWEVSGTISVFDSMIKKKILEQIFYMAGTYCGLCDWRPKSKTPGQFGRFTVKLEAIK